MIAKNRVYICSSSRATQTGFFEPVTKTCGFITVVVKTEGKDKDKQGGLCKTN